MQSVDWPQEGLPLAGMWQCRHPTWLELGCLLPSRCILLAGTLWVVAGPSLSDVFIDEGASKTALTEMRRAVAVLLQAGLTSILHRH